VDSPQTAQRLPIDVTYDGGYDARAAIGFILLSSERVIEREVLRLAPEGVGVHFTRLPFAVDISIAGLSSLSDQLSSAAASLLPDGDIDVITYACTSGSLIIGEDFVMERIREGAPRSQATTLITGVVRALNALEARRIAMGTPYLEEVNEREVRYLEEQGFSVINSLGLQIREDRDISRVTPETLRRLAHSVDRPDADVVFLSCGGIRSMGLVNALEAELEKPVVVSNQAMMWDVLRLADISDSISGYGRLLEHF
jgi:maleate isomerase